jgi:hypothetical protein
MAQAGYTPISLYYSTTAAAAPTAGNLVPGELAINITDGKLYYEDNLGVVKVIAGSGGSGVVAGSNTQIQFNNNGVFGASSNLTWNGTALGVTGALSVSGDGTFSGTGQIKLPVGTTGQRSGTPVDGMLRYNSDLDSFEGYVDGAWGGVGGAQAGGVIYENNLTISANYTLTTNKNGMSVGPITIASGVSVTIPSGQRWVVL